MTERPPSDSTVSAGGSEVACRVQVSGLLLKRPIGHESAKWSKRFFVVKDSFLLYYPDSAQKAMEKSQSIGLHPKGILPLGGCSIEASSEPGHPHCLQITAEETAVKISLAADSEYERNRWLRVIEQAARVTWRNAQLGDAMIQQLERRGMEITIEKQEYIDRLNMKTAELETEAQRAQELETINDELVKEKATLERLAAELHIEHGNVKQELECKLLEVQQLAAVQQELLETSQDLHQTLEELAAEKRQVSAELRRQQAETDELSRDRHTLCHVTDALATKLKDIETKMAELSDEKSQAETRLKEHQSQTDKLLAEKRDITLHANELQQSLHDLARQKELTDSELREEISARLAAEKRLREAEESLARIEARLQQQDTYRNISTSACVTGAESPLSGGTTSQTPTLQQSQQDVQDMIADVKTLKKYFENVVFDATLEANKTLMIKRSIQVRKDVRHRQARTVMFHQSQPIKDEFNDFLRRKHGLSSCIEEDATQSDVIVLPTSPNDVSSNDHVFAASARLALRNPSLRHSCFDVLKRIDSMQSN